MANERDLVLNKYSISRNEYRELLYFCRQYPDKKRELAACYELEVIEPDGMPKGNSTSNPTESKALRAEKLSKDIAMIENAALKVMPYCYRELIKNVTEGKPYSSLQIHYSERHFYRIKRKFFKALYEARFFL